MQAACYSGILIVLMLLWKSFKFYRSNWGSAIIPAFDTRKSHLWHHIDILSHSAYCNVCEGMIVDGMYCDSCGICADTACHNEANQRMSCKSLSVMSVADSKTRSSSSSVQNVPKTLMHHFVKGNLAAHSMCAVCREECVDNNTLSDYRCCWCQRVVHEERCYNMVVEHECDLGKWKNMIVPPYAVKLKSMWYKGHRQLVVESLTEAAPTDGPWTPLIVVANRKSGDNDGEKIIRAFRSILNPTQVIDLNESSIENALEWCRLLKKSKHNAKVKILVAGGGAFFCNGAEQRSVVVC